MMRRTLIMLLIAGIFLLIDANAYAGKIRKRKIRKLFKHSLIVKDHFTGFALYDMDAGKMIYELNSDKYFTPASNTKLFTFYTCLKMLGDSIPALKYTTRNDSLIFWGTGDPAFLHTDLKGVNGANLLKNSDRKLFFASGQYQNEFYGSGWAWDDYNDYYQAEITELPIEGNVAVLYADKNGSLQISPLLLKQYLKCDSNYKPPAYKVQREFLTNNFVYPAMTIPADYHKEIPWKTSTALTLALLQDTLKKQISEIHLPLPDSAKTIYDANADTVYKHMLQPSDNFIAEQLLLVCSSVKFKIMNADSVIAYSKAHYLNDLPDVPQWVDGSGLSRFNLFTPRSIVALLCKISDEMKNDSLLHSLMPIGGIAGTIKSAYKTDNGQPFVWAKTGSLSNNHNQSGYLITRKGKRLAFSFMNNNFTRPTREIRDEMVRIITYIHDNY
ncbi:MAG TPA: D-alanyl-D-alanine carboxypeptidase [Mucilaginibacter sp.]|nr:D-alanyl-D-alanine carboxypeptidase [Mucilaginibacter sp.]